MQTEQYTNITLEESGPGISARRRLQNRMAQRRFRERAANRTAAEQQQQQTPYMSQENAGYAASFSQGFDTNEALQLLASNITVPTIDQVTSLTFASADVSTYNGAAAAAGIAYAGMAGQYNGYDPQLYQQYQQQQQAYAANFPSPIARAGSVASIPTEVSSPQSYGSDSHSTSKASPMQAASPDHDTSNDEEVNNPSLPLLHLATRSRNHSVMRVLLQRGASTVDERDAWGRTALHIAVEIGDEVLVGLLLQRGADPRAKDLYGREVLHWAVRMGRSGVVEMLLDSMER